LETDCGPLRVKRVLSKLLHATPAIITLGRRICFSFDIASMPSFSNAYTSIQNAELCSEQFAKNEDSKDELSRLRNEFRIPTKADLKNKKFGFQQQDSTDESSIYFCGNSLGLQPRKTKEYVTRYLDTWASKGVFGHFTEYEGGLPPWLHIDDAIKEQTAKIVGALPSEVVVMETLTANLHLLMSSFYRPTKERWKIIIEGKAFPSDHVCSANYRYTHCIANSQLVRCPLADCPPQSRPFRTHYHRTTFVILSLPL
jgi:kynureninase